MNSGKSQFERDFEAFLEGGDARLDALYRKLPHAEPDAQLDAAVHAMAQRAVAGKAPVPIATRRLWLPAFAAASVVIVAAGVVMRLGPQHSQRPVPAESTVPVTAPAPAAESPPPMPATRESAPAPMAALPRPAPPAPAAKTLPRRVDKAENTSVRPAPQAFPSATPTMRVAAPASSAMQAKPEVSVPAAAGSMRAKQADAESAGAPAASLAAPVEEDRNATLYPEHWLANIRQMLRENRREEALRSLEKFRKRYPDYRLPDDLRDLH